jgi:hypothetical protein
MIDVHGTLTVMSDMDLSHDYLGFWLGWFGLDLVGLDYGMQQVRSLRACFDYMWDACERWSFVATCVTPVSLRPLITVGNLGAWSWLVIV